MKKKIGLWCFIIIMFVLIIFTLIDSNEKVAASKIYNLFHQMFWEAQNDYKEIMDTQSKDVEEWLYEKYGYYFTSNGWELVKESRIISLGINQYREMNSVPQDVKINITERKDIKCWYTCQVELIYENQKTYSYVFTVQSVKTDDGWLIEYISR